MDGLLPNIRGKLEEGTRPRTYQQAKRREKLLVVMNVFSRAIEKGV